jgi:hypothetical protein
MFHITDSRYEISEDETFIPWGGGITRCEVDRTTRVGVPTYRFLVVRNEVGDIVDMPGATQDIRDRLKVGPVTDREMIKLIKFPNEETLPPQPWSFEIYFESLISKDFEESDITLVAQQTNTTREQAIAALTKHCGDIVNSIMELIQITEKTTPTQ